MKKLWGVKIDGLDPEDPAGSLQVYEFTTTAATKSEAQKKARLIAVGAVVKQHNLSPVADAELITRFKNSLHVEECTLGGTLVEPEEFDTPLAI